MKIPNWLKKRSVINDVPKDIKEFGENGGIEFFENISIDLLKRYYQINDGKKFFKLVRLLGFYGIIFSNKLEVYSGPLADNPKVIFVPKDDRNEAIFNINIESTIKTPLSTCGVISLSLLHGVPIACFNRLLGGKLNDLEDYLFSPLSVIPANELFIDFDRSEKIPVNKTDVIKADFIPIINKNVNDLGCKIESEIYAEDYSLDQLNFSVRTKHCLNNSNIKSINELIACTEIELLSKSSFGRGCLIEVKTKLSNLGLQLGMVNSKGVEFYSIDYLNLSKRPRNCLLRAGIENINQLISKKSGEIFSLRGMGTNSYDEIYEKLYAYLTSMPKEVIIPKFDVLHNFKVKILDLKNEEILNRLNTSISDVAMSLRSRNALKNAKIEYVWQLISCTENELLKFKNFGQKSLKEVTKIVFDMHLDFGHEFLSDEIKVIMAYEKTIDENSFNGWFREKINEIKIKSLEFLSEKERIIAKERIFKVKAAKSTLEGLSKVFGMTRERVRQLEGGALRKLRQKYQPELREVVTLIVSKLKELGGIANLLDLEIDINFVSSKDQEIADQIIWLESDSIFIDWKCSLITSNGPVYIEELCDDIQNKIFEIHKDELFTVSMMALSIKEVCETRRIFTNGKFENLAKKFLTKNKVTKEGNYLSIGKMKKIEKIALAFKNLYPQGLEVHKNQDELLSKIREYDPIMFKEATQRSIIARLTAHSNVLLWGRGFFVHENNISYDLTVVNEVIVWILNHFDKGHYRFQVGVPFSKYKDKLIGSGVPNQYALYSLIRKQEIDRIGQRKYPTIVDLEANVNIEEGILEELEAFFKEKKCEVLYEELKSEFVNKRGWKEYSVQQNLCTHSELIYPWKKKSYIHLDYLNVDYSKLKDLIASLKEKLKFINGPYNLKGAKTDMKLLWEQTCPSATTRTIAKLIRQDDLEDLVIDRNFIRFVDTPPESVSTVGALEELFIEKNTKISRYELKEEFIDSRGWTENQFYTAIKNANLFQTGKNTFVHPSTIMWNDKLSQEVHQILSEYLKERNRNQQPHMQIEELIYEYVLPELPNGIEWSRYLLVSVGEELKDFLFFDDAYIFVDNDFDIQDLDDMIAFLLAKEFPYGLAKTKDIEELLWREGILSSGFKISKNQFFQGSSISFSDHNDEISLSLIGKSKYGNI